LKSGHETPEGKHCRQHEVGTDNLLNKWPVKGVLRWWRSTYLEQKIGGEFRDNIWDIGHRQGDAILFVRHFKVFLQPSYARVANI